MFVPGKAREQRPHHRRSHVLMRALDMAARVPWAIRPESLQQIMDIAARVHEPDFEAAAAKLAERQQEIDFQSVSVANGKPLASTNSVRMRGSVAVLPVTGPIFRYGNMFSAISGATSIESMAKDLAIAVKDEDISAILLHVDSPGGEVSGTGEFAEMLYEARGKKPIWAYVSNEGCSAAYWIASACDRIVCAPTSIIGSIGVVAAVPDPSKDNSGRLQFVSSQSPNKRPDPNTKEGKDQIQTTIDDLAAEFVSTVARNRGVTPESVIADFGEGGVMVGQKAVDAGLADAVGSFEQCLVQIGQKDVGHKTDTSKATLDTEADVLAAAIPFQKSKGVASENTPWDASKEVSKASGPEELRRMHAWVDSSGDPNSKGSYKLPHHRADGTLVPKGLFAAAGRLDGTNIPASDKAGVRAHLSGHYREINQSAPWDKQKGSKNMNLKDRLIAALAGVSDDDISADESTLAELIPTVTTTGTAATTTFAPQALTVASPLLNAESSELARMRQELVAEREARFRVEMERIHERAQSFAERVISAGKLVPATQTALITLFEQLALVDGKLGSAQFPDGSTSTYLQMLENVVNAQPKNMLDQERLPQALQDLVMLRNELTTSGRTPNNGPMSEARRRELLAQSPIGQQVLETRNGVHKN